MCQAQTLFTQIFINVFLLKPHCYYRRFADKNMKGENDVICICYNAGKEWRWAIISSPLSLKPVLLTRKYRGRSQESSHQKVVPLVQELKLSS